MGYWIAYIAQGWLVLRLTNSPFWLGMVGAASNLPFLLFALAGGALADRFNRTILVAMTNAAIIVLGAVLAVLAGRDALTIASLVVLTFVVGTLLSIGGPIDRAWMYDLVRGERIGTATALSSLEWSVARTFGPALGGVAIATIGVAAGYGAFACAEIPLTILAIVLQASGAPPQRTNASAGLTPGRWRRNERFIITLSLLTAAFTASVVPYISFLPDIARNTLGLDARGYGFLAACGGAGSIVGAIALGLMGESRHKGRLVPAIVLAGAVLLAVLTLLRHVGAAAIVLTLMGGIDTIAWALSNTYVQECASDERRGRANAIFAVAFGGGIPIGNLVLGAIAGRYGSLVALDIGAAVAACSAVTFWLAAPRAREAA